MRLLACAFFLSLIGYTQPPTDSLAIAQKIQEGRQLATTGEMHSGDSLLHIALAEAQGIASLPLERMALQNLGVAARFAGKPSLAISYYEKAAQISLRLQDTLTTGRLYFNIALERHQNQGHFPQAVQGYLKALSFMKVSQDTLGRMSVYQNLGNVYESMADWQQAKSYTEKAMAAIQHFPDSPERTLAIQGLNINLINLDLETANFEQVNSMIAVGDSLAQLTTDAENNYHFFRLKSEYYRIHPSKKDLDRALHLAQTAYDHAQQVDFHYQRSGAHQMMAEIYLDRNQPQKAFSHLQQAQSLYDAAPDLQPDGDLYQLFALYYKKTGQAGKALTALENAQQIQDSVLNERIQHRVNLLDIQYQTAEKNRRISEQNLEIQAHQNRLLQQKQKLYLALGGGILFFVAAVGIWFFFRQKHQLALQKIKGLEQQREIAELEAVIQGEEQERHRIAKELHDGINGDLSALKFQLGAIPESDATGIVHKTMDMLDDSIESIRSIAHNLAPPAITQFGLIEAIRQFCHKLDKNNTLEVVYQHYGNLPKLSPSEETIIYRMVQELSQNTLKHAQASELFIQTNASPSLLQLTVEDNGRGFAPKTAAGLGLKNLDSRIQFLNAQMEVDSSPDGSSYHIEIPLNTKPS
jgi:signal transduction histidine kinase